VAECTKGGAILKKANYLWTGIIAAALLLSACRSRAPEATETVSPDLVFTAAAQTAGAIMTESALLTPSPTTSPSDTPEPPTQTTAPTEAATTPAAVTSAVATTAPPASSGGGGDNSVYVADVTVEDGTDFAPGESFTKTWQIMNNGSTTWGAGYELVFVEGDKMGGPDSVPVPSEVAPGATVNISVNLVAPSQAGDYIGYWRMRNASGVLFGNPFWVDIDVIGSSGGGTSATVTPGPSPTPQAGVVSNVTLSIDDPSVDGTCPHTFRITTGFHLNQAATVNYQLEAGSDTAGFNINLPPPVQKSLSAGSHTLNFDLTFDADIDGWVRFHITSPMDISSDQVSFFLRCR